jgi:hypothetical protein
MAKGDTDRLREMREQRYTEKTRPVSATKKPPRTELQREIDKLIDPKIPAPDLQPTEPPKNVATKSRKQVAEAVGKFRASKARDMKRQLSVWLPADLDRDVRVAVAEDVIKLEAWIEKVLREYLARRAKK